MSDKEILIEAAKHFIRKQAATLFNINSAPARILLDYVVDNAADKYDSIIEMFVDKNDNINIEILESAIKEEFKNGYKIHLFADKYIKLDLKDVEEFIAKYKEIRAGHC